MLVGNSHDEGGVLIEAEGEGISLPKTGSKALGRNLFDFLNFAPLSQVRLAFAGLPIHDIPIPSMFRQSMPQVAVLGREVA
jgi:hypothetical protein